MSTILDTIAEYACFRVAEAKKQFSAGDMRRMAEELAKTEVKRDSGAKQPEFSFEKSLGEGDITFICECKKASPSKGLIAPDFPYLKIAMEYEAAGAGAISVLTEPKWFLGSSDYLKEIAARVSIPCLDRKSVV